MQHPDHWCIVVVPVEQKGVLAVSLLMRYSKICKDFTDILEEHASTCYQLMLPILHSHLR